MEIRELKKLEYSNFINAVRESFLKDYIPLGITKENANSNGSFFTNNHLHKYMLKGVKFFVILDDETIVGGVGILSENDYCKIKKIFVAPKFQGQGIGKVLIDYVDDYAKTLGKSSVKLGMIRENDKLYSFYKKNGFVDKKMSYNKKMNLNIVFMEKNI